MSQLTIALGTAANDGTGDPLRTAFTKINTNFTELYATSATLTGTQTLTNKTLTSPVFGNATSTADADATIDASTTTFYSYIQSASATARTINISNLTSGKMITLYLRNTFGTAKIINIAAGIATTYSAVNMSKGDAGGTSASAVTLVATSGTAIITLFNAGGVIGGSID